MTLRHLEVFTTVVDCGCSITKAAARLHVAQPAVSRTIADLEAHYDVMLFDRLNRRLRLTSDGSRLLAHARRLADSYATLDAAMKASAGRTPLRIGASVTVGTSFLPGVLAAYAEASVNAPVVVSVFNTHVVEHDLLESRLDVGVVEGDIRSTDIRQTRLCGDELLLVCAPSLAANWGQWADGSASRVYILREPGSGTREAALNHFGIAQDAVVWSVSNTQTILELTKAGFGATVIANRLVERDLAEGSLVEPPRGPGRFRRTYHLAIHKDKFIDERLKGFMAACQLSGR
jgi:DNA-binding transcriptional LysR family regulator